MVFAFALAVALASCSHAPSPGSPLHQTVGLSVGQRYRLDDGSTLRFLNVVNDSRCPVGVTCVWAGTATVSVQFSAPDAREAADLLLVLPGGAGPDDVDAHLPVDTLGYRITLVRLEPAPTANAPSGPNATNAKATVSVVRPIP
jgi:hypothetical protein